MAIRHVASKGRDERSLAGPLAARLLDEMLAYRGEWRHDAAAVTDRYRQWSNARSNDERARLYFAHLAALDQEQAAARSYARAVVDVERCGG